MAPQIALRDIHQATAPSWWPLAPGWWIVIAVVVAIIALAWFLRRRKIRRIRKLEAMFDDAVDAAPTPAAQVRAMSELLRRAARRRQREADTFEGETWLRFLDGGYKAPVFDSDAGRLLVDGAFRPGVDETDVRALRDIARRRFIEWMQR
ncbi:DUF4381 domain-containing protein [Solilutibacter silvestris]|uniref:DUF4381 domain-containing protein n=1 Tax=Solilutibacter silvestris TaxID=1645665 RepID=A0A2K1PX38_9GAMM|nr:DUF4381 domain-containing protein [Lysobacter silvestris]PNS07354.1 hypothetical protein Lysil_1530 [Lysobacter silvestris]